MTNELLNEWKKEKIVEDGDIVLAGVSGGADSVCLLLMLEQLQKKTDFLLEAVHVEHGIRGEESRKDAAFVKNLCQDHGIRCHIFSVEVPLFAEKHGLGLEEAARILLVVDHVGLFVQHGDPDMHIFSGHMVLPPSSAQR